MFKLTFLFTLNARFHLYTNKYFRWCKYVVNWGLNLHIILSMKNIQFLTNWISVNKKICKYIGKIDENNYVIIHVDSRVQMVTRRILKYIHLKSMRKNITNRWEIIPISEECLSVICLSLVLASRTTELIHDRVVDFPVPRTSAWLVPRLCPLIELGVYVFPSMMIWSLPFPPSEIHPGSLLLQ